MLLSWLVVGCQRPKPEEVELIATPTPRLVPTYTPTPKGEATPLAEDLLSAISCDLRVIEDSHPYYDINVSEIERLLEDNGVTCPYLAEIELIPGPLWVKNTESAVEFSSGKVKCLFKFCLIRIAPNEMELADTPGHDFSLLKTLEGIDRQNWLSAHELAHVIRHFRKLQPIDDELWYDQFANENYQKYQVVVEQK